MENARFQCGDGFSATDANGPLHTCPKVERGAVLVAVCACMLVQRCALEACEKRNDFPLVEEINLLEKWVTFLKKRGEISYFDP